MNRRTIPLLVTAAAAGLALALGAVVAVLSAPHTQRPWHVKGTGGGGTGSSTNYKVGYTTGQSPIGSGGSTSYGSRLGFWYGGGGAPPGRARAPPPPPPPRPLFRGRPPAPAPPGGEKKKHRPFRPGGGGARGGAPRPV